MVRWLSTLMEYACCARAAGACSASAAPSASAARLSALLIMIPPCMVLMSLFLDRRLQEQHGAAHHEQRTDDAQHALARHVEVHLVADVQSGRHGQKPERVGDLQLRLEQQPGEQED